MKHLTVRLRALFAAALMFAACATPFSATAAIVVNGDASDWADIPRVITDPTGDSGLAPDMIGLRMTLVGDTVYLLYEFADSLVGAGGVFLMIDSDRNTSTGRIAWGLGSEFGITLSEYMSYIGDARDGMFSSGDFPGALIAVLGPTYIEASFPLSVLQTLTPGLTSFDVIGTNDFSDIGTVFLYVPEPPAIFLIAIALSCLLLARRGGEKATSVRTYHLD